MDRLSEIRQTLMYESNLLALGSIHGSAEGFSVVATGEAQKNASRFVLCRDPVVSPSGRFVSFLPFVPRHAQSDSMSELVLIYDLQRSINDMDVVAADEGWVSRASNQGVVVYPGSPRRQRVFPVVVPAPRGAVTIKARTWSSDGELHLIVAVEGDELVAVAINAGPGNSYQARRSRKSVSEVFGSGAKRLWRDVNVYRAAMAGPDEMLVTLEAVAGIPGVQVRFVLQ
jgi:hypothetical protein